jgi:hypothetical protein
MTWAGGYTDDHFASGRRGCLTDIDLFAGVHAVHFVDRLTDSHIAGEKCRDSGGQGQEGPEEVNVPGPLFLMFRFHLSILQHGSGPDSPSTSCSISERKDGQVRGKILIKQSHTRSRHDDPSLAGFSRLINSRATGSGSRRRWLVLQPVRIRSAMPPRCRKCFTESSFFVKGEPARAWML